MLKLGTIPEPGPRLDVERQGVGPAEAGHRHARAGRRAEDQERREERRVPGHPGDVELLLDGDGELALVRRRGERVGARRLLLSLEVLEILAEAVERRELLRLDGQEVAGLVLQPVVAGEEHQGGRVLRLPDHLGHHHFQLLDARPGSGLGVEGPVHMGGPGWLHHCLYLDRTPRSWERSAAPFGAPSGVPSGVPIPCQLTR
jgi:hypothetical protein